MKLTSLNEESQIKAKKGLGLSLTKIKMFDNCAYRYYLQYIIKEKFDKEDFNPRFFKLGQFAHKWIESKINNIECKFDSTTLTDEDKNKTIGACERVFKNDYIKSILGKGQAEKGFSLYITPEEPDGLQVSEKYSRYADFSGYIDYYAKISSIIHIIDWKTGAKLGNDDDTFMQLFLYAKACQKLEGGSKFVLSYFYVDHDVLITRELSLSELDTKIEKIISKGINIPTQNNPTLFPPNAGDMCKYCPYSKTRSSDNKVVCEFAN